MSLEAPPARFPARAGRRHRAGLDLGWAAVRPLGQALIVIHKSVEVRHFGMDAEIQHREVNLYVSTAPKSGICVTGPLPSRPKISASMPK